MLTTLALATHGPGVAFGGGFGWLFLLVPLFWIGFFFLIFSLVGRRWRRAGWAPGYGGYGEWHGGGARSAESSLAERFAQGDIDEKEYRARLEVLRASRPVPPNAK